MLTSIENADRSLCVDLFEDRGGGYGFEHFRSDPEDAGHWTPIGGFASARYHTALGAAEAAEGAVPWLAQQLASSDARADWLLHHDDEL